MGGTQFAGVVPVDRFEIVDGPQVDWGAIMTRLEQLVTPGPVYAHLIFTLRTLASTVAFRRVISLAAISWDKFPVFSFSALFDDKIVSGAYNTVTRTGWFEFS